MTLTLDTIPPEVLLLILSHLPIQSLLSFGATSHTNHTYHLHALSTLRLAVFPKRVHALIAFLEASSSFPISPKSPHHDIPVILPFVPEEAPHPASRHHRTDASNPASVNLSTKSTIETQNALFATLVSRYGPSLRSLEFLAYDLSSLSSTTLAQSCPRLRHLALRFDHPHIRDRSIPRNYWDTPPAGSTVWNALAGTGEKENKALMLRGLESLTIERAGITDWQLRKIVERNPRLRELRLKKCQGVGAEFLEWLGEESVAGREKLRVLWLERCEEVTSDVVTKEEAEEKESKNGLGWVEGMETLQSLSFKHCPNVEGDMVMKLNREVWHIPEVVLPYTAQSPRDEVLEVDPEFK